MKNISKKSKWILLILFIIIVIVVSIIITNTRVIQKIKINYGNTIGKVDDWKYTSSADEYDSISSNSKQAGSGLELSTFSSMSFDSAFDSTVSSDKSIGFSVGGAKDINNFRDNIKNGYLPLSTDITYNGLFYDYSFDTGKTKESEELFSPSYSTSISKDPISNENEYYMTVGLNSNIKEKDFVRKKMNLVILLDISGSMNSSLDNYYYDSMIFDEIIETFSNSKTKMELANESVNILIDQLNNDDRFGMVLFDNNVYLAKDLSLIGDTNIEAIKEHILEIQAQGGTNFETGYKEATSLFDNYENSNQDEYENRIIVITDAMPNIGTTSKNGLMSYVEDNSKDGIYTTFIGVGVDFNTELIESISDVKGANYYSVKSEDEFKSQMGEQFEYMVTPLVFDLKLKLDSDDYKIEQVYGSDTANSLTGELMNVNTLFPSKSDDKGEVKGGVILLKLKKLNNSNGEINLSVEYKDREGENYNNSQKVKFSNNDEYYDNTGIRKAIVLSRYVNVMEDWIIYERLNMSEFNIDYNSGIIDYDNELYDQIKNKLGVNERQSKKIVVSKEYINTFKKFKEYLTKEIGEIGDKTMKQEVEIIDELLEYE